MPQRGRQTQAVTAVVLCVSFQCGGTPQRTPHNDKEPQRHKAQEQALPAAVTQDVHLPFRLRHCPPAQPASGRPAHLPTCVVGVLTQHALYRPHRSVHVTDLGVGNQANLGKLQPKRHLADAADPPTDTSRLQAYSRPPRRPPRSTFTRSVASGSRITPGPPYFHS